MQIRGRIWKDGKFWIVECPTLQADTQGTTRQDGLEMMKDWVRTMLDDPKFHVDVEMDGKDQFIMTFKESKPILALMLQRCRNGAGLTLQEVADRLGKSTRSSIKVFETGKHDPRFETAASLLDAMGYELEISVKKRA